MLNNWLVLNSTKDPDTFWMEVLLNGLPKNTILVQVHLDIQGLNNIKPANESGEKPVKLLTLPSSHLRFT